MLEETETEETVGFFVTFLSLVTWGVGLPGYAYMLGSFILNMRKFLATSETEFHSSIGAGMGSKSSGTKAAAIFAFRK